MDNPSQTDDIRDPAGELNESEDRQRTPAFDEETRDQAPESDQPVIEE
jgi:hypothetical protein